MSNVIRLARYGRQPNAESIAKFLGGHKAANGWSARCPAHDDRKPSLAIRDADDGKVLVRCNAGCGQEAVITELRRLGAWPGTKTEIPARPREIPTVSPEAEDEDVNGTRDALKIWSSAKPAAGTAVETYLHSHGLHMLPPQALRFRPRLEHPSNGFWPAMVALVTRGIDDVPVAVHRTFLARDGSGKAPVEPQAMMLGPSCGGAVRLAPAGDVLTVCVGIENSLAAMQDIGDPARAALSNSGLLTLDLPQSVRNVTVLAQSDEWSKAAARGAALRWMREGRRVRSVFPSGGMDFNDM